MKMGIKHLQKIENFLKENNSFVTASDLRDFLNIDYITVKRALNYLYENNKIKTKTTNKAIYYKIK